MRRGDPAPHFFREPMFFSLDLLYEAVIFGILLGCFYAAVSIGLSVAFGLLDVPHIAHPAFLVLGAYGVYLLGQHGVDPLLAGVLLMPLFFLIGLALYRFYHAVFERRGSDAGLQAVRESGADVVLEKDEEHGVFEIVFQQPLSGHTREVRLGDDFVGSPEYKALYSTYEEFRSLDRPDLVVVDGGETHVAGREKLLEHFLAEGKRGLTISRYKGLGEMNAEELWETTMNTETRTLLQVRLGDDEVAENMFTTLMGDAVEPRRQFIEENALNVRNLDI